jgi:hypothetical protein
VAVAVRFFPDAHSILISEGQGKLRQWQITDSAEIKSVDIGLTSEDIQQREEAYRGWCSEISNTGRKSQVENGATT